MKKLFFLTGLIIALTACGGGVTDIKTGMATGNPSQDDKLAEISDKDRQTLLSDTMKFQYSGMLKSTSEGDAKGVSRSTFSNGEYKLLATFENLPSLDQGFFYEGWLVREKPFDYISTGRVDRINGVFTNVYGSQKDLTEYATYVLTKEQDDGNPKPADHILQGKMKKQ